MNSFKYAFVLLVFAGVGFANTIYIPDQPVDMLDGTFTRTSIAFLNGKQYAANAPRKQIMAVASVADYETVESITVNDIVVTNPRVLCKSGNYLWASGPSPVYAGLYKSIDGNTWTQVQSATALTGVRWIHPTATGSICVDRGYKLYYSSDGTDLTTDAIESGTKQPVITFSEHSESYPFSWHVANNGTIITGEYNAGGGALKLYRSIDNGETFTHVYTETDPGVLHSHCVCKQEALGRWIVSWGDNANVNKITYSDDDGITWSNLETQTEYHFQPIELIDYGHPTRLIYGSDSSWGFGFYDCLTKQIEPFYWDQSTSYKLGAAGSSTRYCWGVIEHEGVFYASTYYNPSLPEEKRLPAIVVSNNLVNWAVYYQFRNAESGIYGMIGVAGNKIHCIVQDETGAIRYGRFSPCTISQYNALCIDPATTNILSENESSMETDAGDWKATGTMESYATEALHGSKSVRLTSTTYSEALRKLNPEPVAAGTSYSGSIAMKASGTNALGQYSWIFSGTNRETARHVFGLGRENWQTLNLEPMTVAAEGETGVNIYIRPNGAGGVLIPSPANIILDCVQIEAGPPTRWQLGGIPRAHEVLTKAHQFGDSWTEYIIWAPATRLDYFLPQWGNQYIKTWYKDSSNYVELYYDPSDFKFKLKATINGVPQNPCSTAKTYKCYTNASVRLIVRADQDFRLSVNYGNSWEHVANTKAFSGIVGSKTGNYMENQVISGSYLSDLLYNYSMSNKRIEMQAQYSGTALYDSIGDIPVNRTRARYDFGDKLQ